MFSQTVVNQITKMNRELKEADDPFILIIPEVFENKDGPLLGYKLNIKQFTESDDHGISESHDLVIFNLNDGETPEQLRNYLVDVNRDSGGNNMAFVLIEVRGRPPEIDKTLFDR